MPNKVTVVHCYLRNGVVESQHKIQAICFTLKLPLSVEMVGMTRTIVVVQRKTLDEFPIFHLFLYFILLAFS